MTGSSPLQSNSSFLWNSVSTETGSGVRGAEGAGDYGQECGQGKATLMGSCSSLPLSLPLYHPSGSDDCTLSPTSAVSHSAQLSSGGGRW